MNQKVGPGLLSFKIFGWSTCSRKVVWNGGEYSFLKDGGFEFIESLMVKVRIKGQDTGAGSFVREGGG